MGQRNQSVMQLLYLFYTIQYHSFVRAFFVWKCAHFFNQWTRYIYITYIYTYTSISEEEEEEEVAEEW